MRSPTLSGSGTGVNDRDNRAKSRFLCLLSAIGFLLSIAAPAIAADLTPGHQAAIQRAERELKAAPDSVPIHIKLQDLWLHNNARLREDVIADYEGRLSAKGDAPGYRYLAIRLMTGSKRAQNLRKLIADHPDSPWGYLGMGEAREAEKDFDGAHEHYRKALSRAPQVPLFHVRIANALGEGGNADAALKTADSAAAKFTDNVDLLTDRIWYLLQLGKNDQAVEQGRAILKQDPDHHTAMLYLAAAYHQSKHYENAIALLKPYLVDWPENHLGWRIMCIASALHSAANYDGRPYGQAAIDACQKATDFEPDHSYVAYLLSLLWDSASPEAPVHVAYFSAKALRLKPSKKIADQLERNLSAALNTLSDGNNFVEYRRPRTMVTDRAALSAADRQGLAGHGDDAAWTALKEAMATGPTRAALDDLVAKFPGFAPAYFNRGLLVFDQCCDPDPLADLNRAVALAPQWGRALGAQAAQLMSRKLFNRAKTVLAAAEAADPGDETVRYNAGLLDMYMRVVVDEAARELKGLAVYVKRTGDTKILDSPAARFFNRLELDRSSQRIYELYADVHAASPHASHWATAIEAYRKAIELGGPADRIGAKIDELQGRKP